MSDERRHRSTASAPEQPRNRLLNARDAIDYLGISLSTLNRIEKEGLLVPFRTPGGHRRYALRMLDEYLESTRHHPERNPESAREEKQTRKRQR